MALRVLSILLLFAVGAHCWLGPLRKVYRPHTLRSKLGDVGEPLFLTPYIEAGKLDEARKLSRVGPLGTTPSLESYSGYLTVNKNYNSNLFFWFFPAQSNPKDAPVVLWLQGGPGGSSLFGLFVENGPYEVGNDNAARLRKYTWNQPFSMIYIDNPVGTGFSFTKSPDGYAQDEDDVARDLYEALQQFFKLFSTYRKNDFYVTGESYAGKYVPAIAYKIHTKGQDSKINLRGIAIGDGLCDPISMLNYADFLYQIGLLDQNQADFFRKEQAKAAQFINNGQYREAFYIFDALLNGDKTNTTSYFTNFTGLNFYYNFLLTESPPSFNYYNSFVQDTNVRRAIHVGNLTYNDGSVVEDYLLEDVMKSMKPNISVLMDNYKVMIYNGQLDIIIAYPLTANFLSGIPWKGVNDFNLAPRKIWKLNPSAVNVAGYVRQVGNFTEVLVRNAGHILPFDQPEAALDMITRFVYGKPFTN